MPAPLFTDHQLRGELTLALLNRQFSRSKVSSDPLTCVSRRKFGAIGIERGLRERATQQIAEPAEHGGNHLLFLPYRTSASNFGYQPDHNHVI